MKIPTEKIRIAFIIDAINVIAGTEKQIMEVINRLDPGLFDITLVCLRPSMEPVDFGDSMHFRYLELGVNKLVSFKAIWKLFWLARYLGQNNISIIQTYFIDATIFGVLAARLAGIKHILSCKRDIGLGYTSSILKILKLVNRFVTRVIANSEAVKEFVAQNESVPLSKIDLIYNGVDILRYGKNEGDRNSNSASTNGRKFRVGIVANLNRPVKRVDLFITAASAVLNTIRNVQFEIIGDGYLKADLVRLADELGLQQHVIFHGRCNDVVPIMSQWDVGTITSDSEGFSNAILEFMAAGIPTVVTDAGGNRETVLNEITGFVVPKGDFREIGKAICTLLTDRQRAVEMGKHGRMLVQEKYCWDAVIKQTEDYYCELLNRQ